MPTPRKFFVDFVVRSFEEFRVKPDDEYLATTAVTYANVMAERMWHYYKDAAPHRVYRAKRAERYRSELGDVCGDFALVRDVAEVFKHVRLGRQDRRVTHADQTGAKDAVWTNDAGEEVRWTAAAGQEATWRTAVLVELDDGSVRPLLDALTSVVAMWDRLTAA
jgi:hypothetical protein